MFIRAIGGAVALAVSIGIGSAAEAGADPTSSAVAQGVSVAIDADKGWAYSNAYVEAGQTFNVSTSGTWTVDYRLWPAVGANGYKPSTDERIYKGCRYADNLPYGRLLGRIGNDGPVFSVGAGGTFQANASGPLNLRINDVNRCLVDNSGYIQVWIA
jgi:hypothetical protein